jgi:hypothetical protein
VRAINAARFVDVAATVEVPEGGLVVVEGNAK